MWVGHTFTQVYPTHTETQIILQRKI